MKNLKRLSLMLSLVVSNGFAHDDMGSTIELMQGVFKSSLRYTGSHGSALYHFRGVQERLLPLAVKQCGKPENVLNATFSFKILRGYGTLNKIVDFDNLHLMKPYVELNDFAHYPDIEASTTFKCKKTTNIN